MDSLLNDCISFTQRLIQTPSMSGREQAIAALIANEMRSRHFDEVWLDDIGNVSGRVYGQERNLKTLVLNSHTDHVDPGDPALWPVPPYSGQIVGERIIGRGACDIKGPLAVQIYSLAALRRNGERPRRDVVFTGVVEEEIGGPGAIYWVEHLDYPVELVLLGEPSSNRLAVGHRGILAMWVTFPGRSVHASVPSKGSNPNYALATFLQRLQSQQSQLTAHPLLGPTTVAPTLIEVDTKSKNVTPAWTRVLLDFRTAAENSRSLQAFVGQLAAGLPHTIQSGWEQMPLPDNDETIYGFYTPPENPIVQRVLPLLNKGMGRETELGNYQFATDGRHFVPYHIPVLGYAPGDESEAHTAGESISISMMAESLHGHIALLREF